jgi:hypothetical protein
VAFEMMQFACQRRDFLLGIERTVIHLSAIECGLLPNRDSRVLFASVT